MAASDTAISAGCAFSVSVRRSAGPFPDDRGQLLAERGIDLVEHRARRRERIGQRLAHADGLAALPWKYECRRHEQPSSPGAARPEIRAERLCDAPQVKRRAPGRQALPSAQNPYNPRFRSSRPGAERTAAFASGATLRANAAGPVGPSSRVPANQSIELSEGLPFKVCTFSKSRLGFAPDSANRRKA